MSECCRWPCHDNLVPPLLRRSRLPQEWKKGKEIWTKKAPFPRKIFTKIFLDQCEIVWYVLCVGCSVKNWKWSKLPWKKEAFCHLTSVLWSRFEICHKRQKDKWWYYFIRRKKINGHEFITFSFSISSLREYFVHFHWKVFVVDDDEKKKNHCENCCRREKST